LLETLLVVLMHASTKSHSGHQVSTTQRAPGLIKRTFSQPANSSHPPPWVTAGGVLQCQRKHTAPCV